MKFRLLSIVLLICFAAVNYLAYSQIQESESNPLEPGVETGAVYFGPVFGYNRAMHPVKLPTFNFDILCPVFNEGDDNGYYLGMSYEHLLGGKVNSKHSIIGRLLYNTMPAYFKIANKDNFPSLVDLIGKDYDSTIYTSLDHTLKVEYQTITLELMYKFMPIEGFGLGITVGPTFDFAIKKTLTQKLELNAEDNVQFRRLTQAELDSLIGEGHDYSGLRYENADRTIVVHDGDIEGSQVFRLGMKVGIQYQINTPKWIIVPSAYYNFGITNLTKTPTWRVNAFQAGVDLRYAFTF